MDRRTFTKDLLYGSLSIGGAHAFTNLGKRLSDHESETLQFKKLFNGENLDGFVDVNTSEDTWYVEDGILKCTGEPIGVIRTEDQYENFILDIEWRHMEPGGNSGVFILADGEPYQERPFPTGIEVQMVDPGIAEIRDIVEDYAHGQLFPVSGLEGTIPDTPFEISPSRSNPIEFRVNGAGEWNRYIITCLDGVIKLSVNGKFVNGIRSENRKKGFICPESEGYEVHFKKIDIMELPGGIINPEQAAPRVE
jgi:hypothetical protein